MNTGNLIPCLHFDTVRILFSQLLEMVELPDFQRVKDDDHVIEIFTYNETYYKLYGSFNIFGSISIGKVIIGDNCKYFILDGQHRINAYKLLLDQYGDFMISADIYERSSVEEIQDIYDRINRNKPVPLLTDNYLQTAIVNKTTQLFVQKFGSYVKTSKKPHPPNINIERLHASIITSEILQKCNITTAEELMSLIVECNMFFCSLPYHILTQKQVSWGINIKIDKTPLVVSDSLFMLGYFPEYEWLGFITSHLLEGISYSEMNFYTVKNTANIPKQRRNELWYTHFNDRTDGVCYVCGQNINIFDFEAGHVVPRAFGGSNDILNLRPICKVCNRDMGCQNLEKYKLGFK